jgi:hypothetical protein
MASEEGVHRKKAPPLKGVTKPPKKCKLCPAPKSKADGPRAIAGQ